MRRAVSCPERTMKIAIYSDLHLEFLRDGWRPPKLAVDVVLLPGDIDVGTHGIDWATETFLSGANPPTVIYVAGNHEFYYADINAMFTLLRERASASGVVFLENNHVVLGNTRFLGADLWSNFALYGNGPEVAMSQDQARMFIRDYGVIRNEVPASAQRADPVPALLDPVHTTLMHERSAMWLDETLSKPFNGKTVVVTHFAPHLGCVDPRFNGDALSPYFVSDMAWLMRKHQIDLWVFGHTHHSVDFEADNGCRVVSNQRGYPHDIGSTLNRRFRESLVVEL